MSIPPVWDNVPFDVGCARCGHDLRGLTEPTCPACGLTFDWAKAVPIEQLTCLKCAYHLYGLSETRCPECGTEFTWREVLAGYHRTSNPLFEYAWRRRPIRSLVGTWARALRPGRFWRSMDMHDPPCVGALVVFVMATGVMTALAVPFGHGIVRAIKYGYWSVDFVTVEYWFWNLVEPYPYLFALWALGWSAVSGVALIVPQQTLRRCGTRWQHLLRVWVYCLLASLPILTATVFVASHLLTTSYWAVTIRVNPERTLLAWLAVALFVVHSLRCAFRDYLKLPRSLALAVTSQVIAALALLVAFLWWTVLLPLESV